MPISAGERGGSGWAASVIDRLDELGELEGRWRRLAELRGNAFITPEWIRAWLTHYGAGATPAIVAVTDEAHELRGILPLVESRRGGALVQRFGGSNLGDIFHPAAAVEDEPRVAAAAFAALAARQNRAASIVLDRVEVGAPWLGSAMTAGPGRRLRSIAFRDDVLPLIEYGGGDWETFLAGRSRNLRSQIRRRERALDRDHELKYRLTGDPAEVRADVATFWRLHDARWDRRGGSGSSTELSRAFHADFATAALGRGWLRLWFLELDGEPVASWYGWRLGDRYSFYLSGFDPSFERESVGFVVLSHSMRSALEEGAAVYDLLRGGEDYKFRFATGQRKIETVVLTRRGHPIGLLAGAEAGLWRLGQRLPSQVRKPATAMYRAIARTLRSGLTDGTAS